MREVSVHELSEVVCTLFLQACCKLEPGLVKCLEQARENERSDFGQNMLEQMIQNAQIASIENRPICQDTGMAVVFLEVGQQVVFVDGDLTEAINDGVRRAYKEGYFRNSVLDPLSRINTGVNTPAIIHTTIIPGEKVNISVAPKGFGSENMGRLGMLTPSQGTEGVIDFVVETVRLAGANPCPPLVVGIGIGGTMEYACFMAKHALLRSVGEPSKDIRLQKLEKTMLDKINRLGIGPQGLGGDTTALAVHIETFPTHIAGLPVAVNLQCHVARHKHHTL